MPTGNGPTARDARVDPYVDDHAAFGLEGTAAPPSALTALRQSGLDQLVVQGFPSPRDEEWRFTNVAPLLARPWRRAAPSAPKGAVQEAAAAVQRWGIPDALRLVFVDGHFAPELSTIHDLPDGAAVGSLGTLLTEPGADALAHLGRHAHPVGNPFTALNTAFLADGAYVHVGRGIVLERPVQLLQLATGSEPSDGRVSYPRALVVLDESAQATLVESFVPARPGPHFTCAVSELAVGDNAVLDHYRLQEEDTAAHHVAAMCLSQGRDSVVRSHNLSVGAALSRTDVTALLAGEGVDCTLNGLYVAGGDQHVDTHMRVEHARPHGGSHELYKGILDDRARAVFNGRIYVRKEAQKTDAKQSNRNLLLSSEALVNSNPQLEIFADDVKCTHGSTVGQLDAEAVFYLRSRGIDEAAARSLLIYAFLGDILQGIRVAALRAALEATLRARLPGGDIVGELA